ncbi:MAG: YihY/virulence factor BrkB family protein [Prevotella sp.]|nr:YihY/virulence factor BrkB family protein [Prevotella sp.]
MWKKIVDIAKFLVSELSAKRVFDSAAALTYSTLLAIVPILAVVFAVARGFGYNKYIEDWFRNALASQPQAAEILVGFVNSYLVHTKSGIILGMGLLFMLWTVLMLVSNVEKTFNAIWQVKIPRGLFRTFTDYFAMLFLVPIIIVLMAGISIFMATVASNLDQYLVIGPIWRFLIKLSPYIIMSGVFIAMYVFIPNTKVKLKSAIVPGILAGIAMQLLQYLYIHSQIWVSSYNAIYGSFAALPLFMLWVQFSWSICLFGAELTYTTQNLEDYAFLADSSEMSHRYRIMLSGILMSLICKRADEEGSPYTALQLKLATDIPIRITHDLLYDLCRAGLLKEYVGSDEKSEEPVFVPVGSIDKLSFGKMVDRLEALGKWTLTVDLHQFSNPNWEKAFSIRRNYLNNGRDILLKDL